MENNDRTAVEVILRYNVDVDRKDNESGCSPVALAAHHGNTEILRLLADNNATLDNTIDNEGNWPIHLAARGDNLEAMQYLLENGADIEARSFANMTPLHTASKYGKRVAAQFLVDHGAHLEARGGKNYTALHYAVGEDDVALVRFFIKRGSDIEAKTFEGMSVLSIAAELGHEDIVSLLLDNSANIATKDDELRTPIHHAAYHGHQVIVEILLNNGADPTAETKNGNTAQALATGQGHTAIANLLTQRVSTSKHNSIMQSITKLISATRNGNAAEVARLVDGSANVNLIDPNGRRPISIAAENGHEPVLKLLIDYGANPDLQDANGESALWWAARYGHEEIVRTLLAQGAHVDAADSDGQSPLSVASQKGFEEIVRCLLKKGSNPNSSVSYGKTPLLFATAGDHHRVVELLISHGASIDDSSSDDSSSQDETSVSFADAHDRGDVSELPQIQDALEYPPYRKARHTENLIVAVLNGRLAEITRLIRAGVKVNGANDAIVEAASAGEDAAIRMLIQHGAPVDLQDEDGRTPLWVAAYFGHISTVKLLYEQGAKLDTQENDGRTPLSCASGCGEQEIVELLLELGAEKETKDGQSRTALWHAASEGHVATAETLLENGANIESADIINWTPLTIAVFNASHPVVKLLLEKGARMKPESLHNYSPLCLASIFGSEGLVELLIDHGADLNHLSDNGETPIIAAARRGHTMIAKILIERGADVHIKKDNGRSALSYAKEFGNEPLVKLLSQAATLVQSNNRAIKKAEQEALNKRSNYEYRPLKKAGYIRVLELDPGRKGDIISFELYDVDLSKSPPFEALSYEWKEKSGTVPVQCGAERLLVTPNCKAALERIRHETNTRSLWIDAVCINQEDKEERNQQVAAMTEIYGRATSVLMWIGEADNETQAAFKHIPILCKLHEALLKDANGYSWNHFDIRERDDVQDLARDVMADQMAINGLTSLLSSEYFKRAWIFQEILIAGTRGLVMLGQHRCPWKTFKAALLGSTCIPAIGQRLLEFFSFYDIVRCDDHRRQFGQQLEPIVAGMLMTAFKASDPRDKIFATLRLASVENDKDVERPIADYTLTVQEVCVHASRYFIDYSAGMEVWDLSHRSSAKTQPNLPSWVADFTQQIKDLYYYPFAGKQPKYYKFIDGRPTTTPIILRIDGCLIDKVAFKISVTKEKDVYEIVKPAVLALARQTRSVYAPYLGRSSEHEMKKRLAARWRRRKRARTFYRRKKVTRRYRANTTRDQAQQITNGHVLLDTIFGSRSVAGYNPKQVAAFLAWKLSTDSDIPACSRQAPRSLQGMIDLWEARSEARDDFDLDICHNMEDKVRYDRDLVYTHSGYFGLTNKGEAEEGLWVAVVGGSMDLVLLREKRSGGDTWYEFVDRIYLNYYGAKVEKLEDMRGNTTIQRLEIR